MNNEENNLFCMPFGTGKRTENQLSGWTNIICRECGCINSTNMSSMDLKEKKDWISSCYYRNSYNNCEHQFKEY